MHITSTPCQKKSRVEELTSGVSLGLILLLVQLCSAWFLSPPSFPCLGLITAPLPSWKLLSGRVYLCPQMKPQVSSDYLCLHPSHGFPIIPCPRALLPCTSALQVSWALTLPRLQPPSPFLPTTFSSIILPFLFWVCQPSSSCPSPYSMLLPGWLFRSKIWWLLHL